MRRLTSLLLCLCAFFSVSMAQIRVACVGNSITEGHGLSDPATEAYPGVLQRLLGDDYVVQNFGLSGYTMMREGDSPYMNASDPAKRRFQAALASNPDIVTIKLGTNDSKARNWDHFKDDFAPSFNAMVDSFQCLPSHPFIYICLPIPAAGENFSIRPEVVDNEICPLLKELAAKRGLPVIDLNTAMRPYLETLDDMIHPNRVGSALIAEEIARRLLVDRAEGKFKK